LHPRAAAATVNTLKRRNALHAARRPVADVRTAAWALPNPACVPGPDGSCQHPLVDAALNQRLFDYECRVRGRFESIVPTLKAMSAVQHEADFVERAQAMARHSLGYSLPEPLLAHAWVAGLDLRRLHSFCIFRSFQECVRRAGEDQAPWRERAAVDAAFLHACGLHTLDVSPCADGRLQGLLPFVLRVAPHPAVQVKAYAGALFDVETDLADWAWRELERRQGTLAAGPQAQYLKIAAYHYSSSLPAHQGCAAHGSNDTQARSAAARRLAELRSAVQNSFGAGCAPLTLLIGVDTDTDAIRIHLPAADVDDGAVLDSAALFRDTLGLRADDAREAIAMGVARAERGQPLPAGLRRLIERLLEANLSQIEYVIQHHEGRYLELGHNEAFICAGEAMCELQLRNQFYFAHLDTAEEGANDLDVGVRIFTGLNVERGLPVPVLVHFHYASQVAGARERAVARCRRVKAAIESRYAALHARGLLHCEMAVSDLRGSERCSFIDASVAPAAGATMH
jgi:carboxysome shell carbonic anhydrase